MADWGAGAVIRGLIIKRSHLMLPTHCRSLLIFSLRYIHRLLLCSQDLKGEQCMEYCGHSPTLRKDCERTEGWVA